jgi:hypothetical protein
MQGIKVRWAKQLILTFNIVAILIKLDIRFAPINYNMHKTSIIKVIKVNTVSIMIIIIITNIL